MILCGPSGSGKSTCIQALIDALCANPRGMSSSSQTSRVQAAGKQAGDNHRLQRINPCVVDDYQTMFGSANAQNDWIDGIFTHIWRKANRVSVNAYTYHLPIYCTCH